MRKNFIYIAAFLIFAGIAGALTYSSTKAMPVNLAIEIVENVKDPGAPKLPDISQFTVDKIAAKAPPFKPGKVDIISMFNVPPLREFIKKDGRVQRQRLAQYKVVPQAIAVLEGDYDFSHLYEAINAIDPKAILKDGETYTLRLPLYVAPGASLTISGGDVDELRLSKERATLIAGGGDLYILRTKIIGWNETEDKPAAFKEILDYRPFIVSWSQSKMYIAGSTISHMGYRKGKSYGLTYSSCPDCLLQNPDLPRPTGAIVGNKFTQMYYGFYSFEADDVAIVGNKYFDNIVYAIDPHDRSRRLIIAENETYNTHKKHGIIISREVDDSWIFNNYSHHNKGSGIMIDRSSSNNIIAYNKIHSNEQDGITFFESPNNVTWKNQITKNDKNGIRIRNSWGVVLNNDKIAMNKGTSVEVYTADISGQETRDVKLDPYTEKADVTVNGARIESSGASVFKMGKADHMTLSNIQVAAGTHLFPNSVNYDSDIMTKLLDEDDKTIKITRSALGW